MSHRTPWSAAWTGLSLIALALGLPAARAQPVDAETWEYRVQPGDTLLGLHERLLHPGASWREVQRLNRIANPLRLQPGSLLRIPLRLLRGEAVAAELLHLHGEVQVERGGRIEPLRASAPLLEGDVLLTGAKSSASLRFSDGSTALLGPGGRLRIERHVRLAPGGPPETRLRLEQGGVETRVVPARPAPRFELRTPVVNLGVRGTDFRGRVAAETVLAEVLSGRVAVGPQPLDAGFGTKASPQGVEAPRPLLPAPGLGGVPAVLDRLPLQFAFDAVPGAARYRVQVFDAAQPDRMLLDGQFDAPRAAWPEDLPDGRYELRVRAAAADAIEGFASRQAFTLKARPTPPFQLRPRAAERLPNETVVFGWSRHPEAARYRLQVAATPDFRAPLIERTELADTAFSAALPPGTYHWRVASVRSSGDAGPWGDGAEFVREPPPPPAPAALPSQASEAGLLLRWAAAPVPGLRYQVQVARDAAFARLLIDETSAASERLLATPEPGEYHVRVRAVGADGRAGGFGPAQVVEVPRDYRWLWLLLPLVLLL